MSGTLFIDGIRFDETEEIGVNHLIIIGNDDVDIFMCNFSSDFRVVPVHNQEGEGACGKIYEIKPFIQSPNVGQNYVEFRLMPYYDL